MTREDLKKLKIGDIIEFNAGMTWHFKGIVKKISYEDRGFFVNMTWGDCGGLGKTWLDNHIITNIGCAKVIGKYEVKIPQSESFKTKSGETLSSEIRHAKI